MAADNAKVLDVLAGEYVLGTLDEAERMAAAALLGGDPAFTRLVRDWEARLAPLGDILAPVAPPAVVRERVFARIGGGPATAPEAEPAANVVVLHRQLRVWRGVAAAAIALAAALASVLLIPRAADTPGARYVAVLEPEEKGAAFLISIDLKAGTVSVRRTGATPEAGKAHELWAVGGGRDKPQSLGVIDATMKLKAETLGRFDPETVFAISLEPPGGSPTGAPTGPVLFTGKLVQTE